MAKSLKEAFGNIFGKESASPIDLAVPIELVGSKKEKRRLAGIVNRTAKSELGKKTLEEAAKAGYTLGLVQTSGAYGYCSKAEGVIVLNSSVADKLLVGTLAHEARHAVQNSRDATPDFENVSQIKSSILLICAMEADAERTACKVSWELKQQGDKDVYQSFSSRKPLIAKSFEAAIEKSRNADMAAFKGWYKDSKMKSAYEKVSIIKQLKMIKSKGKGENIEFSKDSTSKHIVEKICLAEDGKTYFTDTPETLEQGKFGNLEKETEAFFKRLAGNRSGKCVFNRLSANSSNNKLLQSLKGGR